MKLKELLLKNTALAIKNRACVFSISDIATMLKISDKKVVAKIMHRACVDGLFINVAKGFYISGLHAVDQLTVIYKIATRLRAGNINYISLESELSHAGVISQIPIDRVTIVTTGRKGVFKTPFGVIEFTHTNRTPIEIGKTVYFDNDIKMFRAKTTQALTDLKRVGRNLHLLEVDVNVE